MLDNLLKLIAPHSCSGCGNIGSILCDQCKNDIVYEPYSNCLLCNLPTSDSNLCLSCHKSTPIDGAWIVSSRDKPMKALIDRYKFKSAKEASRTCVELLHERLPVLPKDLVITSVPTSSVHRRVRGFDHAELIAKGVARRRSRLYRQYLLKVDSGTQHFRSRTERLNAAQNGLSVIRRVPEVILLIDDIYTTGATLHACVKTLKQAGAKQVLVGIIAKQTLDDSADLW